MLPSKKQKLFYHVSGYEKKKTVYSCRLLNEKNVLLLQISVGKTAAAPEAASPVGGGAYQYISFEGISGLTFEEVNIQSMFLS